MGTVYFVNGFLESGKTTFIKELLAKESFRIPGKTLIILCEEGDLEYERNELTETNSVVELIEEEENFNEDYIISIEKKHRPDRVIVEYNGMWNRKNIVFPWYWNDIMEIAILDAATFKIYSENLRPFLAEQVRGAELIVFYKADKVRDKLASYVRNIKAINNKAGFVLRGEEGDIILDPDESLPYDINAEEIILDDIGFTVMCIDSLERTESYEGKKITFMACVYKMKDGEDFEFAAGRQVMTCCEADMTFTGIICAYPKAYELKEKDWVEITGLIRVKYDEVIQREIPVCRVLELTLCDPPEKEIIEFNVSS